MSRAWAARISSYTALLAGADITSQIVRGDVRSTTEIDWREVCRMASFGGLISAPAVHGWYVLSSRLFGEAAAGAALRVQLASVAPKVALEQVVLAPSLIATAIAWNATLDGCDLSYVASKLKQDLTPAWARAAVVWSSCACCELAGIAVLLSSHLRFLRLRQSVC